METSRRGSVTRDQRGEDEHIRERQDHRDRKYRRGRSRSSDKRVVHHDDGETERKSRRHAEGYQPDHNHLSLRHEQREKSPQRRRSKSRHRSPRPGSRRSREQRPGHDYSEQATGEGSTRETYVDSNRRRGRRSRSPDTKSTRHHHRSEELDPSDSTRHHRDDFHLPAELEGSGRDRYSGDTVRHHPRRQTSPTQVREHSHHSRRYRSPERRWTQAEIDEYYRRRDEEDWRARRESARDRRDRYEDFLPEASWSTKRPSPEAHTHTNRDEYPDRRRSSRSPRYLRYQEDRMEGTRPIQSVMDDREPRGQRIPSFEGSHRGRGRGRGGFDSGRGRGSYHHGHGLPPPSVDTRHQYASNSHYSTPAGSFHGSPHSASPYSQHGGWQTPQQAQHYYNTPPAHAYAAAPQSRHGSYPPQQTPSYYPPQPHQYSPQTQASAYPPATYRGGHGPPRGGSYQPHQERRFASGPVGGSPPPSSAQPASRSGRGHFQNLRWTAGGGTQGGKHPENGPTGTPESQEQSVPTTAPPPPPPAPKDPSPPPIEEDNPFRPSKAFRVEDDSQNAEEKVVPKEADPAPKEPKFSFAFKGKAAPASTTKPVTDLTQKMKDPPAAPRRDVLEAAPKKPSGFDSESAPSKPASDKRPDSKDPRDRYADQRAEREREAERYKLERQSAMTKPGPPRRDAERYKTKPQPQVIKQKVTRKRQKPRPQVPAEFKASRSVYFRKQGNESVVGSGTYGKVYKGVHVYTNALVALKKIRMEGEKDGFPVTAVREIKLLQSLRHENVVRLQEVMVENNDCYMVFEYLSHDLTGLLNHPTFKLEQSHKKHLASQLFSSLDYLHRRGVLHRDLKAANILVSSSGQLKLADFGLARFYSKHHTLDYTNRVITIWYRPPELLLGETQYGPCVDIWSAACVLVEIFTKHAIFPGDGGEINQLEKIYNILGTPTRAEWPRLADMAWFELLRPIERRRSVFRERYADRVSPEAFNLLSAMFQYDPAKRPSASQVLQHPYFSAEDPAPQQVTELANVDGDWHEFESKALRKENERRARKQAETDKDKVKRRASSHVTGDAQRDSKRLKSDNVADSKEGSTNAESAHDLEPNMQPS